MEVRAAVATAPHHPFSIEVLTLDDPAPNEVLVELAGVGICHTDLAVVRQYMALPMPIVLGHEGAGRVVRVGSAIDDLEPGDHVVLTFNSCGACKACKSDHPAYCVEYGQRNFAGRRIDGSHTFCRHSGDPVGGAFHGQSSFATHALATRRSTVKVRKDAPLHLLGALGCGFQTGAGTVLNVLQPTPQSTLVILGAGALGFSALFAAVLSGVERIIAVDRVTSRLALAQELGAHEVIDTSGRDIDAALSGIDGIDYIVETTGAPKVAAAAIARLNAGGQCALLGGGSDRMITIDMMGLIRGKVIRGVVEGDANPQTFIPQLVDAFMEGRFPIDRISRTYRFDDINTAVADTDTGEAIKPVLVF